MKNSLKATLLTALLSSVAVAPIATVTFVASADAAYAKSDKGGGKGGGNSASSKKSDKGAKTKTTRGGGSAKAGKSGGGLNGLLDKITGKDKKQQKVAKRSGTSAAKTKAPKVASAPQARKVKDAMHPSNLGKMNGALNANINAVLAHIKNGNTNGPVGAMAFLAVGKATAAEGQLVFDLQNDFLTLDEQLGLAGYDSVEAYYAALDGEEPIAPIPAIEEAITALGDAQQSEADLKAALESAGYFGDSALADYLAAGAGVMQVDDAIEAYTDPADAEADLAQALTDAMYEGDDPLADYQADKDGTPPIEEITDLSDAIATLGGNAGERSDITETEPTAEELEIAAEQVAAEGEAEDYILSMWNKADTAPEETEEQLLAALHEKLDANADAIAAAIAETQPDEVDPLEDPLDEDVAGCEAEDADCVEEEDMAAAE